MLFEHRPPRSVASPVSAEHAPGLLSRAPFATFQADGHSGENGLVSSASIASPGHPDQATDWKRGTRDRQHGFSLYMMAVCGHLARQQDSMVDDGSLAVSRLLSLPGAWAWDTIAVPVPIGRQPFPQRAPTLETLSFYIILHNCGFASMVARFVLTHRGDGGVATPRSRGEKRPAARGIPVRGLATVFRGILGGVARAGTGGPP